MHLLDLFESPGSMLGQPWYTDKHDDGELMHAKVWVLGDSFQVDGLRELALKNAFGNHKLTFDSQSRRDAVAYLMDDRVNELEQKNVYMQIARALWNDLRRFGLRSHAWDMVQEYEILKKYIFRGVFHDEAIQNESWLPLAERPDED